MDDERLIMEVEKYKILYDTTDPYYKDNVRKDKAWFLIAGVLGVDADSCKARWKALRDEWKYREIMSFLLPYVQPRRSKSNLTQTITEERPAPGREHQHRLPGKPEGAKDKTQTLGSG
ncbi:hypothetical protein JOB18_027729 [Solea senegalensis]|uniref:MADF domain-containing protein n=1 Tax=Solea senegalensis TaxID=28829 RepID=A0AAV6PNC9_SOLSE|nr:hypothetical protein JOB18_027729 [Solea senegalensis]